MTCRRCRGDLPALYVVALVAAAAGGVAAGFFAVFLGLGVA